MEEIRNKVKESGILTIDLADFNPRATLMEIDIANQLIEGLILKEKLFRDWISINEWDAYSGCAVYVHCSTDAIIPTWAYMLVASKLIDQGVPFVIGSKNDLQRQLIFNKINALDLNQYQDGRVMIKGCSDIAEPEYAMTELMKLLQPVVRSIMYGEPCSSVPVFKRK